jgi:hypothetical protein
MLAETAEWSVVRRLKIRQFGRLATGDRWTRQLMVNVCTLSLSLTLDYTLTLDLEVSGKRRPEIIG